MASLVVHLPGAAPVSVPLVKALTTMGSGADSDIRVDEGFLIVVEDGAPRVEVARNFQRQDIQNAVERLSDSIVERVLQSRQPVIVSDALNDAQFNASASVVNLKLSSVMCVPLVRRGELYGAVYVGNDRIANLFTERELTLMTSFCAPAALLLERALELDELRTEKRELLSRLEEQAYGDIIGACDVMRDIFRKIDKVAGANIDVLVTGESGTGKELIARELHRRSPRKAGPFRENLFYRINVVHLHLPPLRDRGEDAVMLAKYFLSRATRELSSKVKGFSSQALVAIKRYRWPGNIRQLENRIKKAVVLADKPLISPDDLELRPEQLEPILALAEARDEWQKRYINEVLERNGGNRTKTAKDLGVDPRTIFRHLERMEAERRGEALPPDPLDSEG